MVVAYWVRVRREGGGLGRSVEGRGRRRRGGCFLCLGRCLGEWQDQEYLLPGDRLRDNIPRIFRRSVMAKFMVVPHYTYAIMKILGPHGIITLHADIKQLFVCDKKSRRLAQSQEVACSLLGGSPACCWVPRQRWNPDKEDNQWGGTIDGVNPTCCLN